VQTTLLGLAIALIIALVAALIGPYFVDWNQFRPQFEAEASQVIGAPVRVAGELDARLLPSPSLRLRSVVVGGANDLGKVRADKLDVEFSLGSLMRGEWRATDLSIGGMALDLGLDPKGAIDWPTGNGKFNLGSLAIDRLHLTGRAALHDALSHRTLELNDIAFSGDVRSLAGSLRGDGNFTVSGARYPFRVTSSQNPDGNGVRVHLVVDSSARPASADLDGVLNFEGRAPRFDGTVTLAATPKPEKGKDLLGVPYSRAPWRVSARIKADHAAAKLEQIETSYGPEEAGIKLAGAGDVRFGTSPLLHAALSSRQIDIDRFAGKVLSAGGVRPNDPVPIGGAAEPVRVLPALRALMNAIPEMPILSQVELNAEQTVLGGRSLQNVSVELRSDPTSWAIDRLDVRAPGATRVLLNGQAVDAASGHFKGALNIESSDPDALVMWLQGRSELGYRSQNPFRLSGDVDIAGNSVAIENVKCELDGGTVEGRIAFGRDPAKGAALDATLKAERLELDSATAFARGLLGPQNEWPDRARLSLEIGHAISAGQDLHPFAAKLGYDPKMLTLESLKIGEAGSVTLEGKGSFDRANATGKLALNSSAASLSQLAGSIAPLWPQVAARLNAMKPAPGPAQLKLAFAIDKEAARGDRNAQVSIDLDAPQLKGAATISARPGTATVRDADLDKLLHGEISVETKLSSEHGASLLALLGLDSAIGVRDGPGQLQASATGAWGTPLRLKLDLTGSGFEAEAQGTADPFTAMDLNAIQTNLSLKARGLNLTPLFGLKPSDGLAQDIGLSSRISLAGGKLVFDDIDATTAGSRLRGRLAMTLGDERKVEGEVGLDALDLGPALALAIGAAGRDTDEPFSTTFLKGWRGQIAFQALRGVLPGGSELHPFSGTVKADGQSLIIDNIKGGIGGGEMGGNIEARQTAAGLALNARVTLGGVDGTALRYRGLAMPAGRASLQMTLASQGRSASALTGAISGNGTVTLEAARITGLDPRAFDVALRASDAGEAIDDVRLRKLVEPALLGGALLVSSAQIPFTLRDGRLRVAATALEADGIRAIVSGGYDIPADQADLRAALTVPGAGAGQASPPEIQVFAAGPPDALNRTVDVGALSSWLAVRAIDRETRRLDSIERGDATPASISPPVPPHADAPNVVSPAAPSAEPPRSPPRPRMSAPRSNAVPPAGSSAAANAPPVSSADSAPVVSQQVPPLPPAIVVHPAPTVRPARPRAPLMLTPPSVVQPAF
jgi:uncharacterized protein involved in outer membrane biogenesis